MVKGLHCRIYQATLQANYRQTSAGRQQSWFTIRRLVFFISVFPLSIEVNENVGYIMYRGYGTCRQRLEYKDLISSLKQKDD